MKLANPHQTDIFNVHNVNRGIYGTTSVIHRERSGIEESFS